MQRLWYYYDGSGICGVEHNGTVYYFQKNLRGDVTRIYDGNGNLAAQYVYDAWGNHKVLNANGTEITDESFIGNVNPIRYRGYYYDEETGLYYLQSRYYDPEVGRFINADDIDYIEPETLMGCNLYAYCGNNPVMCMDPNGNAVITITALLGVLKLIAIGFGIGATIAGGFEIGRQIHANGWNPGTWDWGQIGLTALGGGMAGAITVLPVPGFKSLGLFGKVLSYGWTFTMGRIGSVAGGLVSGSVTNWETAGFAFAIGGVANVLGRGLGDGISKLLAKKSQKVLQNNYIYNELSLEDLIGSGLKNNGVPLVYSKFIDKTVKLLMYSKGLFAKSTLYSILAAALSSILSGWY